MSMEEEKDLTLEELKALREFKMNLFQTYWENSASFYAHILPHPNLEIGKRGLQGDENLNGILLAFGQTATKEISSQPDYLYAELQFGYTWEKLIIPWDCMYRIYDKSQYAITQMRVILRDIESLSATTKSSKSKKTTKEKSTPTDSKVIEVDFSRGKK